MLKIFAGLKALPIELSNERTQEAVMFRVERSQLLEQIWNLTQAESVLLTGSPGAGKSWTIAQLIRRCRAEHRPHLAVAAEDFDVSSIDELRSALGFKREVLPFLEGLGKNAILVVDGLDALRSETSQKTFLELITDVSARIPRCAIVVSVRTFDFQQSDKLQRLFFGDRTGLESRKFNLIVVEPFSDSDLGEVAKQVPGIEPLIQSSNEQFRELLDAPISIDCNTTEPNSRAFNISSLTCLF
jgi:Cdc6-like AAA superfamily ATPase